MRGPSGRWNHRGQQSKNLWQRFAERHPQLAAPIIGVGAGVGGFVVDSAKGPLADVVKDRVAEWTSHIAVVGPALAKYVSDPAGSLVTGLAVGAVAGGWSLWQSHQRRRHGEPEPEDPAARLDRVDRTATEAKQQATRANTRGDVAQRQISELQQEVGSLKAQLARMEQLFQAVGQQASTADARAVLAQSEVRDVQTHQLVQDGRLDQVVDELQQRTQAGNPTLPPDMAAQIRAANARTQQQRAAAAGRQSPPSQQNPQLGQSSAQPPRPDPPGPSR